MSSPPLLPPSPRIQKKGPSQRQQRVGEEIRQVIAMLLIQEGCPGITPLSVTITRVTVSPDLRQATLFFTYSEKQEGEKTLSHPSHSQQGGMSESKRILRALMDHRQELRYQMAQNLTLRYVPEIRFAVDESLVFAQRIEHLLDQIKAPRSQT